MTKPAGSRLSTHSNDAVCMDVSATPFDVSAGKLLKRLNPTHPGKPA